MEEEKYHIKLFSDTPEDIIIIQEALALTGLHFEVWKRKTPLGLTMLKDGLL